MATTVRKRSPGELAVERVVAGLLLFNAVLLSGFPYFCPLIIGENLISGQSFYGACELAVSRPLFPLTLFLAALDAALAIALWRAGLRMRRWVLWWAALGALAWGTLTLLSHGNLYALAQFFVAAVVLFLLGGIVLRILFPGAFWLVAFFTVPLLIVFVYSFAKRGIYPGQIEWVFHPENYVRFFDPLYLSIFARSFRIAAITTLLCFLFGYPLAYFIARQPAHRRNTLLLLLMIPFWTNFVVRTYAWELILSNQGFLNTFWTEQLHGFFLGLQQHVGGVFSPLVQVTSQPVQLLYTETAVIIGLVYGWITDMTLPCYAAVERLDFSLVEAAKDLYANDLRAFLRIVLPLSLPGIVAGAILVFIPSLGAYITPDILGGAKMDMIGNLIQRQFGAAGDWPFGAAISFVLMTVMLAGTLIYFRVGGKTA
jgi:spermidine/putrescine transport system permease protein